MKLKKSKRLARIQCWTPLCWMRIINKSRNQFIPGAVFWEDGAWQQEQEGQRLNLIGAYCRKGQITAMPVI